MLFKKINNNSYVSNGESFLLVYTTSTKDIIYCGSHKGEVSGKNLTVESYTSIEDIIQRVKDLNLNLNEEQANKIIERAKIKKVTLSKIVKKEISDYIEKNKKV